MLSNKEVQKYIKEHPSFSNRKIAKRLHLPRRKVQEIRSLLLKESSLKEEKKLRLIPERLRNKLEGVLTRENCIYLAIFLLALFLRIGYFAFLKKNYILTIPLLDAHYYLQWAKKIAEGGIIGQKVFFTEPLYAYILALFLKISSFGPKIMIFFQNLLGCLLPIIVLKIGEKIFNRSIGLLAGIIAAIYGPFIFYENFFLKTSLEIFSLSLFVLYLLNIFSKTKKWQYFLAGVFLGTLALLKGNNLLLFPLVIYFILVLPLKEYKTKIALVSLFTAGFVFIISPVTLRNYIVGKDFDLINYSVGMNFYQGNRWGSDGSLLQPQFIRPHPKYEEIDSYKMAEAYQERALKPSEVSQFWIKKTFSEISEDMGNWLALMGKKLLLLINWVEMSDNYDYAFYKKFIPLLALLPDFKFIILSLSGIVFLLFFNDLKKTLIEHSESRFSFNSSDAKGNKSQESIKEEVFNLKKKIILGVIGVYAFSIVIMHVNSRYRMPLMPFLIILAVVALWYIFIKLRSKDYIKLILIVAILTSFFFLTAIYLGNFRFMSDANFYNNLGSYYLDQKDYSNARKYFEKAIEINKNYAWAYGNLFDIYLRSGEFDLAKDSLQKQLELRPDDLESYNNLKLFEELKGRPPDEIKNRLDQEKIKAEKSMKNRYDPYFYEAIRFIRQKRYLEAEKYLRKSAEKFNNPENTLLNLAFVRKVMGDTEEAKILLERIIRKNPYFIAAKYNLANIYLQEKKFDKEAQLLQDIYNMVPEYGQVWFYLGKAYISAGNREAATPIVKAFIKRYKDDPSKKKEIKTFEDFLESNKE